MIEAFKMKIQFNKKRYLAQEIYKQSPYFVQPPGIKRCECCQKRWYTVEFYELDESERPDAKCPVCHQCWKRLARMGKDVVDRHGITRTCATCKATKPLTSFPANGSKNIIDDRCMDCHASRRSKPTPVRNKGFFTKRGRRLPKKGKKR